MKKILFVCTTGVMMIACSDNQRSSSVTVSDSSNAKEHAHMDSGNNMEMQGGAHSVFKSSMDKNMEDMKALTPSGNIDVDFAALMKLHHMSAIETSQIEMEKGQDEQMKAMAKKMLTDQQKEVAQLTDYLSANNTKGSNEAYFKEAMAMMHGMNMNMDHSGSTDRQFAAMMIPHHQSGVDMSKAYIKMGAKNAELIRLANNIIASQEKEIKELTAWLDKNP